MLDVMCHQNVYIVALRIVRSRFCALRVFFGAGYAPAGQLLFLACPSKSNQKERHPAYRPQQKTLGVPCVARHAGRLRNSHVPLRGALLEQVLADTPRNGCATRRCTGAPQNQVNTSEASTVCAFASEMEISTACLIHQSRATPVVSAFVVWQGYFRVGKEATAD